MVKIVDAVVLGASIGGCLAALSIAKKGFHVILTEEYAWIGGQFTSQGVPSDEHDLIEKYGCTKSYRMFRNRVRELYKNDPLVKDEVKNDKELNPGGGWVSRISHDPRLTLQILHEMLEEYVENGLITILTGYKPVGTDTSNDKINEILIENVSTQEQHILKAKIFLDATDTGEVLPLTQTEYVTGRESKAMYQELHALDEADPYDMQSITWICALEYCEGENHTIEKPEKYDFFKNYQMNYADDVILSWYGPDGNNKGKKRLYGMFGWPKGEDGRVIPCLFPYRRVINGSNYKEKINDVSLINWPQNDYYLGNVIEDYNAEFHKYMSKQQTLSLVYWLQTEAKRPDGGKGYPGLKLRGDVLGTTDGLAQAPYIRESRRLKALYTIKEQDISVENNKSLPHFWDTIGIGSYKIDMHMTTKSNSYFYYATWPFEIPLGSIIPQKTKNLLAACKNIGTTHLTNSCYRLHPVEWNIGESAGYFAAFCLEHDLLPHEVYSSKDSVRKFQTELDSVGVELHWSEDINNLYK
ncbi:MAG: dependent oxidoreductase [Haloplasmataceae bacterium]|jgi:hypothetical protein|nr:dependent oxidoreductase [Haloplasmataceae bacterium]